MKRLLTLCAGLSLLGGLTVGCSDTAKTQKETTIETPGGTTTETTTHEVEKSGENPPASPSERANP